MSSPATRIWDLFPAVANAVREDHKKAELIGAHDFVHAFRVGEVARQIAFDEWGNESLSHLAGIAGLTHNADRIIQKETGLGKRDVQPLAIRNRVAMWIGSNLLPDELPQVQDAVVAHSAPNSSTDGNVTIALKDADRVVNLDADLFIRSGQHYSDLPAVDYAHLLDDPDATYRDPKSVLRDIAYSLDWVDPESNVCVRTVLGKEMGDARAKVFRTFFDALREQLGEEGMRPYPFEG